MLHWALANLWPSPWWLPDLTVAGLVVAIARRPDRWLGLALAAAGLTVFWAIRDGGLIFVSLVACGAALRACAEQWDVGDLPMQRVLAAAAAAILHGLILWVHGWWSWPVGLMWLVHAGLTGLAAGIISAAAAHRVPSSAR
jgi:hypothetical protein